MLGLVPTYYEKIYDLGYIYIWNSEFYLKVYTRPRLLENWNERNTEYLSKGNYNQK